MKTLNIFLFGLIILCSSCSKDNDINTLNSEINFEGTYKGNLECMGSLEEDNGVEVVLVITKVEDNLYKADFGDETIFDGYVKDNTFVIDKQTINEDAGFDMVTMELVMSITSLENFRIEMETSVDDEGSSTCNFIMTKK